jgi:hypothetical protein
MGPKPKPTSKPNTRSGAAHTRPVSRKRQASNADQQPSKRTRRRTNEADYDVDEERDPGEDEDPPEAEDEDEDDEVYNPPSRGGKRGHEVKIGPPQRYVGHDRQRSCPISFFLPFFRMLNPFPQENRPRSGSQ